MQKFKFEILFSLTLFVVGCGGSDTSQPKAPIKYSFSVNESQPSPDTKIFVIAGSRDSANFAQEIIDQKKYWMGQGYKESEIACYYVPPSRDNVEDPEQFISLEKDLRNCFFADIRLIRKHIASLRNTDASSIYFYFTSHGSKPFKDSDFSETSKEVQKQASEVMQFTMWTNTYTLDVEGMLDRNEYLWASTAKRILTYAKDQPDEADDYLFTPRSFKKMLDELPNSLRKFVVLSGCHTGGFILPEAQVGADLTLRTVNQITVMTASREDRSSFGCNVDGFKTVFDSTFDSTLKAIGASNFETIDWHGFYEKISEGVSKEEVKEKIATNKRSLPQFFSNQTVEMAAH